MVEGRPIPTLPTYPTPRGVALPPDNKFQKPLMKAIKSHMKPHTKLNHKGRREKKENFGPPARGVKYW